MISKYNSFIQNEKQGIRLPKTMSAGSTNLPVGNIPCISSMRIAKIRPIKAGLFFNDKIFVLEEK